MPAVSINLFLRKFKTSLFFDPLHQQSTLCKVAGVLVLGWFKMIRSVQVTNVKKRKLKKIVLLTNKSLFFPDI